MSSALSSPPSLAVRSHSASSASAQPPVSPAAGQGWMTDIMRTIQAQVQRASTVDEQADGDVDGGHSSDGAVDWERLRQLSPRWEETVERMSQTMSTAEPTTMHAVLLWLCSQPIELCIELLADAALQEQAAAEAAAIAAQTPPSPPAFQAPAAHRHSWLLLSGLFDSLPRSSRSLALFGSQPRVKLDVLQQGLKDWLGIAVQHCPLPLLDMAEAKGELSSDEVYLWWSVWGSFEYRAKCSARGSTSTGGAALFLYHFQYKLLEAVRGVGGSSSAGSGSPLACITISQFMKALGQFWTTNAGYAGFQRAGENGFKRRLLLAESLAAAAAGGSASAAAPAKGLPWGEVIALLLSKDMPDTFRRLIQYKPPALGGPGAQTPQPFSAGAGGVSGPDGRFETLDWLKRFADDEAAYGKALVTAALSSHERVLRPFIFAPDTPPAASLNPWAPAEAQAAVASARALAASDALPQLDFPALISELLERDSHPSPTPPGRLLRAMHTLRFVGGFFLAEELDPRQTTLSQFTALFLRGVDRRERARVASAAADAAAAAAAASMSASGGSSGSAAPSTPRGLRTPTTPRSAASTPRGAAGPAATPDLKRSGSSSSSVATPRSTSKSRAAAAAASSSSSDAATPLRRSTSHKKKASPSPHSNGGYAVAAADSSPAPVTPRGRSRQPGPGSASATPATPVDLGRSSRASLGSSSARAPRCASASPSRYRPAESEETPLEAQARRRSAAAAASRRSGGGGGAYTPREGSRLLEPGRLARASAEINLGPADYDTPQSTLSDRGTIIRGKPEPDLSIAKRAALPGPGAYSPPSSSLSPRGGAAFRGRNELDLHAQHLARNPGPGTYDSGSTLSEKGPTLRGKNDLDLAAQSQAKNPGPGAYDSGSTLSAQGPTLRGKNDLDLAAQSRARNPGPGAYDPPASALSPRGPALRPEADEISQAAEAASQARRARLPGPGAYEAASGFVAMRPLPGQKAYGGHKRSGSAPSFGSISPRHLVASAIPGPSLKARPVDHSLARAAALPAPGAYDVASTLGSGAPAAALRSRLPVMPTSNLAVPPPGAYDAALLSDMGALSMSPRATKGPFVRGKSLDRMAPRPATSVSVATEEAIILHKYRAT